MEWVSGTYNIIRMGLELLYFISGVGLIVTVWIGLRQLKLLKKDIDTKNKRASVEKSIEYLNWFATDFIPQSNNFQDKANKEQIQFYKGPYNTEFVFDENCKKDSGYITNLITFSYKNDGVNMLNQLEYFSAALLSGLADEELAFNPLGLFYCDFIERLYPVICYNRQNLSEDEDRSSMYSYNIRLYKIWNNRINKEKLERKRSKLDESISNIQDERISSIGGK
jgi:hypothetical protein